jgi:hypothetical protein
MGWQTHPDRHRLTRAPFGHTAPSALAAAGLYTYGYAHGAAGDYVPGARCTSGDPGSCLVDPAVTNRGTDDLLVGTDIPSMVILGEYESILPGDTSVIPGEMPALTIYHEVGATGTALWSLRSGLSKTPISGDGAHPGFAHELSGRIIGARNTAVTLTLTALFDITVTALDVWAAASPSTAGTYGLECEKNGTDDMLDSAPEDLTALVAGTATQPTLTGTAANLSLEKGDTIVLTATASDHALTNGTFYALIEATRG